LPAAVQIDASKLADSLPYLHLIWSGPLQLLIAVLMLCHYLGPSGLAGLGVMIFSMPLNVKARRRTRLHARPPCCTPHFLCCARPA